MLDSFTCCIFGYTGVRGHYPVANLLRPWIGPGNIRSSSDKEPEDYLAQSDSAERRSSRMPGSPGEEEETLRTGRATLVLYCQYFRSRNRQKHHEMRMKNKVALERTTYKIANINSE
ncbi:hypothetical protein NDU88_007483 [Pleurodeles waltl]|uniref:Uncharacterized protein n=1 Tax=Pleurodeles waltl TaxID=8319 RepID=A0AAV7SSM4_PLEWA|nr:hypothetical protein NDU88_007483 [Pleurodeles waltl]